MTHFTSKLVLTSASAADDVLESARIGPQCCFELRPDGVVKAAIVAGCRVRVIEGCALCVDDTSPLAVDKVVSVTLDSAVQRVLVGANVPVSSETRHVCSV